MTLKTCTCGQTVTTKTAVRFSRNPWGLWFTCHACATTLFLRAQLELKPKKKRVV